MLDPARGDGAFYNALSAYITRHWCKIDNRGDFSDWTAPVDWIVTDPPWSRFRDFLEHSMRVALVRDAGFGLRRALFVDSPAEWPSSRFQLAAVWLQRGWDRPAEIGGL